MTYIDSQRTRYIGAVAVRACSGAIGQILESSAIHSFRGAVYSSLQKIYTLIISHFPVTTQDNRGFFAASFEMVGGAV